MHILNLRLSPLVLAALVMAAAHLSGCSGTSSLQKGETLYTGSELTLTSAGDVPEEGDLTAALEQQLSPEPNGKFLGLFTLKLWLYDRGIFKESLGEPPVLLQTVSPDRVAARMKTILENKGFFLATVGYTIHEADQRADIEYTIAVTAPYRIGSLAVSGDSTLLLDSIRAVMPQTLLHSNEPFDVALLAKERERIDGALKDRGFFHFTSEYLYFQADSTAGDRTVDLTLTVKKGIPAEAKRVYEMGNIYVYSGYTLTRDTVAIIPGDTVTVGGYHYIDLDNKFDPASVIRSIFLQQGRHYRKEDHDLTLNRLMNLGVFKFVNIRFEAADSAGVPRLDAHIYLTPQLLKTIRFELQGVSKSNNFAGPAFNSSYQNKNLLSGAELFKLSLDASFETSISSTEAGSSYQAGIRTELQLPLFITPFGAVNVTTRFVPKTRFAFGFRMLDRLKYYQMMTADAEFGYTWRETVLKEHELNPFAITFAHLTKRTEAFNALLATNPLLERSYEEQFIVGENYTFTYNDQLDESRKNHLYFKGGADFSGNILYAVQSLLSGRKGTPDNPKRILGKVYSQFSKFDIDLRHYYHADNRMLLASRIIAGAGFAYGNSSTLPYVKQYFIGGSNSLRAFNARTLGPGSYIMPDSLASGVFTDQAGDIRLEANLDLRFPIYGFVQGAVFLDAGNIWLVREDRARPGSRFSTRTFLDEIAVGTGFGVRFDLSFFVIRFDLAWPLRVPSRPSGDRWVLDRMRVWDPDWMKDNLVLNVAIGFPF